MFCGPPVYSSSLLLCNVLNFKPQLPHPPSIFIMLLYLSSHHISLCLHIISLEITWSFRISLYQSFAGCWLCIFVCTWLMEITSLHNDHPTCSSKHLHTTSSSTHINISSLIRGSASNHQPLNSVEGNYILPLRYEFNWSLIIILILITYNMFVYFYLSSCQESSVVGGPFANHSDDNTTVAFQLHWSTGMNCSNCRVLF